MGIAVGSNGHTSTFLKPFIIVPGGNSQHGPGYLACINGRLETSVILVA